MTQRFVVSPDVLFREVDGEAVLLSLESETYFGLDPVATRMWQVLTESPSLDDARATLLAEYDVTPAQLEYDLHALVEKLVAHGLLVVSRDPA